METTTIEKRKDQQEWLNQYKGSYKSMLDELIENYESAIGGQESVDKGRVKELAREVVRDEVVREALE